MKKPKAKKAAKKPREKPLSLYGLSFDDAVARVARVKPPKKANSRTIDPLAIFCSVACFVTYIIPVFVPPITAEIEVGEGEHGGAIFSLGGQDGGYGLDVRDGHPVFVGNFLGRSLTRVTSQNALMAGPAKLRAEFAYDGGGLGQGGTMSLFVDGKEVGEGRMERTHAITLELGGTLDLGEDTGSAVDDTYTPPFRFNGAIRQVTVDLKRN